MPQTLVRLALKKIGLPAGRCVLIGDTPYDGEAVMAAGVAAIGLLSGGFAREPLLESGAVNVRADGGSKPQLAGNETAGQ